MVRLTLGEHRSVHSTEDWKQKVAPIGSIPDDFESRSDCSGNPVRTNHLRRVRDIQRRVQRPKLDLVRSTGKLLTGKLKLSRGALFVQPLIPRGPNVIVDV